MKLRHMSLHVPKLHYTYQCIGITSLFVQEHFLAESNMISRSHPTALASIAVHLTLTSGKSKVLNMIKHGYHMLFLFYDFVCFLCFSSGVKHDEIFFLCFFLIHLFSHRDHTQCTLFTPQTFTQPLFSISPGYYSLP